MALKLYNTTSKQKEKFTADHDVRMYHCGPTVYNYAHIGNLRAYIFADTLRRTLEANGYTVRQVINITDIGHLVSDGDEGEDKMTKALKREGLPLTREAMKTIAHKYEQAFIDDLNLLNIKLPTHLPRASEHIAEDIDLINRLEKKNLTYQISDGIYFDVSAYPAYGLLGGLSDASIARIANNREKRDPRDFALWKFNPDLGWESPWGKGFPGWHIECSAMSMKYLGESFDIHTGGIDHIATHHNNEIAQSEGATGKPLARFWMHSAFLTINEERIAKSAGNAIFLHDLLANGIHPISYRYFLLQAQYNSPVNFTYQALEHAQQALHSLITSYYALDHSSSTEKNEELFQKVKNQFLTAINDNLNTPKVLAVLHETLHHTAMNQATKKALLDFFDTVLGFNLSGLAVQLHTIPEEIQDYVQKRQVAKEQHDFTTADTIRDSLLSKGFILQDTADGTSVERTLTNLAHELHQAIQRT